MNRSEVVNKIKNSISFVTAINVQNLDENTSLRRDYKLDSFDLSEIGFGIKDRFNIGAINSQQAKADTINEIADIVMQYEK